MRCIYLKTKWLYTFLFKKIDFYHLFFLNKISFFWKKRNRVLLIYNVIHAQVLIQNWSKHNRYDKYKFRENNPKKNNDFLNKEDLFYMKSLKY